MELTARKKQILKIVVLSDMGYLEQPHTSAGRIPSPLGYRLYVNELMERKPISAEEAAQINDTLRQELKGTDQVIAKTGQMVSSFVDYPTYAVADHTGIGPADMNAHLMNLSDQVSGQWFLLLNQVVEYAVELLKESQQHEVFTNGASQLLKFPEFRDIDKAHDLMHFMVDSKEQLPVPADGRAMQILIGPENVNDALKESSVVVASYDIGDGMRGLVGVVGPTRMDYATVAARLSYFAESLTRMFGKHELPPKENEIQ